MTAATKPKRAVAKAGPYGVPLSRVSDRKLLLTLTDAGSDRLSVELARWGGNPANVARHLIRPMVRLLLERGYDEEDFRTMAYDGWLRATYSFDPARGCELSTLAAQTIWSRFSAECKWLGRSNRNGRPTVSLSRLVDPADRDCPDVLSLLADPRAADPTTSADLDGLDAAVRKLSYRERHVFELRYPRDGREPALLEDVGRSIGVSHAYAGAIQRRALEKIRAAMLGEGAA